ncbi:superoxide dismutase [Ni] [Candidatus Hydrogenedentota bacterium]
MKKLYFAVLFLVLTMFAGQLAYAHCQIPCGIYDDDARLKALAEHITTIEKSMKLITELSSDPGKNANQIVRWTINKENHADEFAEIVTKYFLQQRVKPVAKKTQGRSAYLEKLTLCHEMLVGAMKAKQTTDIENAAKLKESLEKFTKACKGPSKGKKASTKKKADRTKKDKKSATGSESR